VTHRSARLVRRSCEMRIFGRERHTPVHVQPRSCRCQQQHRQQHLSTNVAGVTAGGTDPRRRCATTQCDHAAMALNTVAHDMRMHSSYCVQYDNDSIWQQSIVYHQNQELNDHFIPCSICRGNKICILTEAQRYTYSYYSIYTIPECKNAFLQLRGLQNQNSQCTRKF